MPGVVPPAVSCSFDQVPRKCDLARETPSQTGARRCFELAARRCSYELVDVDKEKDTSAETAGQIQDTNKTRRARSVSSWVICVTKGSGSRTPPFGASRTPSRRGCCHRARRGQGPIAAHQWQRRLSGPVLRRMRSAEGRASRRAPDLHPATVSRRSDNVNVDGLIDTRSSRRSSAHDANEWRHSATHRPIVPLTPPCLLSADSEFFALWYIVVVLVQLPPQLSTLLVSIEGGEEGCFESLVLGTLAEVAVHLACALRR